MTAQDAMIETIAAAMFNHRLIVDDAGKSTCACGWWITPLLDSVHRLHVADRVLSTVLLGSAQVIGERIVEERRLAYQDAAARTHAVGLLLADSGDITPMGTRMLDKIWESGERGGSTGG